MSVPVQQALAQLAATQQRAGNLTVQTFTYTMIFTSVASLATATANLLIDAASDFLIVSQAVAAVDDVTTLAVASAALIQINDSGSSSNLFNAPIPLTNAFGTAQLPFLLPMPRLFSANSTITGTLNNKTTANATTFFLTFQGMKIWK